MRTDHLNQLYELIDRTTTANYVFETSSYGRSISDENWEEIEPTHIELWRSASKILNQRTISSHSDSISINVDWIPIANLHERHYRAMKQIERLTKRGSTDFSKVRFPRRSAKCNISVTRNCGNILAATSLIESFIHDIFLILNIAAPGSCNFYRSSLSGFGRVNEISLSNVFFEAAQLTSARHTWIKIQSLSLTDVASWFATVRSGTSQIPKGPMENALFSLLHLARSSMSPMTVVWIFFALENLLQARPGTNLSTLIERLRILLELDTQGHSLLNKHMRKLYDIRSGLVHGGFEVAHVMHNELLDSRVNENFQKVTAATDFGCTILLAAIQKTVAKGWKYPAFSQSISGGELNN